MRQITIKGQSRLFTLATDNYILILQLYHSILKIIIDHRPPVFVMENVKGILSAKVDGESVLQKILRDLSKPKAAVKPQASKIQSPGARCRCRNFDAWRLVWALVFRL